MNTETVNTESPAVTTEPVTPLEAVTAAPSDVPTQAEKTFTQKELDEIVQKRVAKAERKARQEARGNEVRQEVQPDVRPSRTNFGNDDDFADAVAAWSRNQYSKEQSTRDSIEKVTRIMREAKAISGFDQETFETLSISEIVRDAIVDADRKTGAQLVAWLTANPDDADRIYKLPPARQAAEIAAAE